MKKVYYLSTCDTCKRIMKPLDLSDFECNDIKKIAISADQLAEIRELTDSYESLFSKRARKYKELGLKEKNLSEEDYKKYLLQDYTFLKRPVFLVEGEIFIGNSKKTIQDVTERLSK